MNRKTHVRPRGWEKNEATHLVAHLERWAVRSNNSIIHIYPDEESVTLEFGFANGSTVTIMMSAEDATNIASYISDAAELSRFGQSC